VKFSFVIETKKNDFIEAVHQTRVDAQSMPIPLFHEGFKSSRWLNF